MFIVEDMGSKPRRPRRAFTKDFVLTETVVGDWVRRADIDAGTRSDGLTTAEREELAALRRESWL